MTKYLMTNDEVAGSSFRGAGGERKFDLEERTARFGEAIIAFAKAITGNVVNQTNLFNHVYMYGWQKNVRAGANSR